jgi:hypothetical protein
MPEEEGSEAGLEPWFTETQVSALPPQKCHTHIRIFMFWFRKIKSSNKLFLQKAEIWGKYYMCCPVSLPFRFQPHGLLERLWVSRVL